MTKTNIFFRILLVLSTAESYVLVDKSGCETEDGNQGECTLIEDCANPGSAPTRRKSRRFSCVGKNMVCCPFNGGRRRSSVQKIIYKKSTNQECEAQAGTAPPDPKSGCCGREVEGVNRIYGGKIADISQHPWLALFQYTNDQGERTQHICSAFLISSRYVLTAKHCITSVKREDVKPTAIVLGEYDRLNATDCVDTEGGGSRCTTTTTVAIESVKLHATKDLALVRLASPAPYTDYIRPLCLPESDVTRSPVEGLEFTVAGWGYVERRPPRGSRVKRHTQVPFVPYDKCYGLYKASKKMRPGEQICAGGVGGHDSCNGDSGAPLVYDNGDYAEAAGVVSFGASHCGLEGYPAVHVNVYEARGWILDNTAA